MIPQAQIIGQTITAVLEGPTTNEGVWLEEFGESHWTDFVLQLQNGLLLHLREYDLTPYTEELDQLQPATLEQHAYSSPRPRTMERSEIEGRKIIFVGGLPDDSIHVFTDSGIGVGVFGAPGGNMLSFSKELTNDMIDYWTQAPLTPNTPQHTQAHTPTSAPNT